MKLKQAYLAVYAIRRRKTKQGKRKAVLKLCAIVKKELGL
jgi:hypothetical protein